MVQAIEAYTKAYRPWKAQAKRIVKRYANEASSDDDSESYTSEDSSFNILFANTETTRPSIFSAEPVSVVERRHKDADPVGLMAAEILQRALASELEKDRLMNTFNRITLDILLVGRGVPWIRYEADIEGDEGSEKVTGERSPIDYVHWNDFAHSPLRTWAEIRKRGFVARCSKMNELEIAERFPGKEALVSYEGDKGETEHNPDEVFGRVDQVDKQAKIWELWDAVTKTVYWFNPGYTDQFLDKSEDYLQLEDFFPCPSPVYSAGTNENLIPIPDFTKYSILAEELDVITSKIGDLTSELNVRGVFDNTIPKLGTLVNSSEDGNFLVGVDNLVDALGAGGKIGNVIQFLPLDAIAAALAVLYNAREQVKSTIYEISGIADITRGSVNPNEKLGQSRLKSQSTSRRLEVRRRDMEGLIKETLRLKAEIMAEQYAPEYLRELSGYDFLPQVQNIRKSGNPQAEQYVEDLFSQAVQLLKSDKMRGFRLDIETNSTILQDEQEEKQSRMEFLTAAGQFIEQMVPLTQQVPQLAPLAAEMLLFGVRGFRAGRTMEASFEQAVEQLRSGQEQQEQQQEGQPPQPDPAEQEAQIKAQQTQAEGAAKMQNLQLQQSVAEAQAQQQMAKIEADSIISQAKTEAEIIKAQTELEVSELRADVDRQKALIELATKQQG